MIAGQNSDSLKNKISLLDSLIINQKFNDAKTFYKNELFSFSQNDDVKILDKYNVFLNNILQIDSSFKKVKRSRLNLFSKKLQIMFRKEIAGKMATSLFSQFQEELKGNNYKNAYIYYSLAMFYKQLFNIREKERLLNNYKSAYNLFLSEEYENALQKIENFKNENIRTIALKNICDSLGFLYNELEKDTKYQIKEKQWWSPKQIIDKKWYSSISFNYGIHKHFNKKVFKFSNSSTNKSALIEGEIINPLAFSFAGQFGYFLSPRFLFGTKILYSIAKHNKIALGREALIEYKLKFDSDHLATDIYIKYFFREKVGARPYIDLGFGAMWSKWEDVKLNDSTQISGITRDNDVYFIGKKSTDAFLDFEFGIDYLSNSESNYFFSLFVQNRFVFNESIEIYLRQTEAGIKIGYLLDSLMF